MIRKIVLYGLLFNFGVVLGDFTQEDLEAFLEGLRGSVKVDYTPLTFPAEITLMNEEAKEAWTDFLSTHTSSIREIHEIPAAVTNCFRKYSREASEEEQALLEEWGVKELRIIDFDSIVSGLEEEQQVEVLKLKTKGNFALADAIEEWSEKISVENTYRLKVNEGSDVHYYNYTLNSESIEKIRGSIRAILRAMWLHKSSHNTLVLSLLLLSDLNFYMSDRYAFYHNTIEFKLIDVDSTAISVCHELNHALHRKLGIEWKASMTGILNSKLECNLFQLQNTPLITMIRDRIPSALCQSLLRDMIPNVEPKKFFTLARLSIFWNNLEEIWNMIGFANVENCVYVNRMSDMNLTRFVYLFRRRHCNYTDPSFISQSLEGIGFIKRIYCKWIVNINDFFEKLEDEVKENAMIPEAEAWEVWGQLQGRSKLHNISDTIPILLQTSEQPSS